MIETIWMLMVSVLAGALLTGMYAYSAMFSYSNMSEKIEEIRREQAREDERKKREPELRLDLTDQLMRGDPCRLTSSQLQEIARVVSLPVLENLVRTTRRV